ncbi:MAG: undecaprenyldiphospho-muramoylpentapeptide beta-N-acetylglucosaminyltransferase [Acidimicrobiia bacterium]|nr:undecaprenyldiphospho-muramoylpentapeptide beta-N-acetylglucosaminyltransferase [Acidimicrobiia bacterium]
MTDQSTPSVFALVTGGGTGGHVYPALAVAQELVRRGHGQSTIHFVGAERGLEATAVPAAGFTIDLLPGRGIQRSLRPAAVRANIGALVGACRAFGRAFRLVGKLRPRVVLGVGGFASLPCVVAARLRRVPAVVHEQNAAPGLANRIGVRFGARAAVSFADTSLRKAVLTGNPIRPEIAGVVRAPTAPPLIAVFGGSLGARRLNDATLFLYERWRDRTDVAIVHVAGARDYERCSTLLAEQRTPSDRLQYELRAYEEQMAGVYSAATMVMCRAGAITIAELAATGVPALLVPLPNAPHDHQTRNAEALATLGAAVLVPDSELDGERLDRELRRLLDDRALLERMGRAGHSIARPDAAARVADMVEEAARAA